MQGSTINFTADNILTSHFMKHFYIFSKRLHIKGENGFISLLFSNITVIFPAVIVLKNFLTFSNIIRYPKKCSQLPTNILCGIVLMDILHLGTFLEIYNFKVK